MEHNSEPTIEQFRDQVYPRYIEKGIEPPEAGSALEEQLFGRWLNGWRKMHQNDQ